MRIWLVEHRPDVLEGCTEAIGEVGGFSLTVHDDLRLYLIQTAEKGMAWLNLIADGQAGHGSFRNDDNAVTELAAAVARIGAYEWPHKITDAQRAFLDAVSEAFGIELDPDRAEETLARLGSIARMVGRHDGQHREPDDAAGRLQAQRHPRPGHGGHRRPVRARRRGRVLRHHRRPARRQGPLRGAWPTTRRVETEFAGALVEAMQSCLVAEDPAARAVPYLMSGGTDAKAWDRARHPLLRLRPAAAAARPGLRQPVPRGGRAGADLIAGVRARVLDRFLDRGLVLVA